MVQKAKEINGSMKIFDGDLDEKVIRLLAHGASCQVNAMCSILGGIVGQEVLKASSGKFHPINQFFYFDSVESLPSEIECNPWVGGDEFKGSGCRYDDQVLYTPAFSGDGSQSTIVEISGQIFCSSYLVTLCDKIWKQMTVFGKSMQKSLNSLNLFVVGAGALGCEFLKNLALIGAGTLDAGGKITVTDDDTIERSNLSRQFLFRDQNIGQSKSTVASDAAKVINSEMNLVALQNRVSPENEVVFNDDFWESLDCVINALDNVKARYVWLSCTHTHVYMFTLRALILLS